MSLFPFAPYIRTPLSDLTGTLITQQKEGDCRDLEMKIINCMEAYGVRRGERKCSDLLEDFHECIRLEKSRLRWIAMRNERLRQVKAGERKKEELYADPPPLGTFQQ